ncbi:helix-turn-helix domain-containing protein [Rhizobium sp. NXC14]|uniref:helix-turn-helix domain-containing protein n=1 Tax=Rhizobium sp. NXC14 TaxID=1981173 RepID=UPI000A202DF0|nr:helix-turn-helix domain-containing protein [Rhizobium sp. NXC14]ARO29924.1 helix-turn-helix domain-containing protein [Rhizobium sp. NXC14]
MTQYAVGTHVRHTKFPQYGIGRVRFCHTNGTSMAVEFENPTMLGHDCAGHGKPNHCRWSKANSLELINPFKAGDTVLVCAFEDRSQPDFFYEHGFAGRQGVVDYAHKDATVTVTVSGFNYNQYVPAADLTLVKVDPVEAVKKATPKVRTIVFQSGSQCDRLVKYLIAGNSITPLVARQLFGVERLAARILEIKKAGHKVTSTIKTDVNGKVYAEYALRKAGRVYA